MQDSINYTTIVKCPVCKFKKEVQMKTNQHMVLYKCPECEAALKPRSGSCCVICSYGSVPCVEAQQLRMKDGGKPSAEFTYKFKKLKKETPAEAGAIFILPKKNENKRDRTLGYKYTNRSWFVKS